MTAVHCPHCGNTVELTSGDNLRQHRLQRGVERSAWCSEGGKTFFHTCLACPKECVSCSHDESNCECYEHQCDHPSERNPGDMHEPKPYTNDLEWSHLAHPFFD